MSAFTDALTRAKTRLFAMSPFIAAGAVASVVTAQDPAVGTIVAVLQTLAGLAGNIAATDIHATLSRRVLHDDVLKNHDLARAVKDAIGVVISKAAQEITDQNEKAVLNKIASVDENSWAEAEVILWLPQAFEGLSEASIVEMFSKTPEGFARFKALELDDWRSIVSGLAAVSAVALDGDIISATGNPKLSGTTVDIVATHLRETFHRALYEILKEDFAHDGKAYGGLLIRLVGNISDRQVETLSAAYDILDLTRTILANTEEIKKHVIEIKDDVKALRDSSQRDELQTLAKRLTPNLPPRNQIFTGRRKVLDKMKTELEKSGRAALSGMPGVGKSQTAVEYAHEQYAAQAYDYVIYARAASETELLADFQRAAQELNLPVKENADFNLVAVAVKAWLGRVDKWLLIFDNADDLRVVRQHTPTNTKGHMLFTRRPDDAGGVAFTIKIEKMSTDEGALLLLRRIGLVKDDNTLAAVAPEIVEQARAIAREMDGLPLSLDIAGAFIKETATRLDEYPGLYRAEGRQLRQERDSNALYEHSVATVFALAFRQVAAPDDDKEESAIIARAAADLLRLCAFFAPDAIPLELILADTSALGEDLLQALGNKIWRKKTIAKATRFSLLDANLRTQTYDMHREAQAVMRDEMDAGTQRLWAERALQTLAVVFPRLGDFANWETCDLLVPHAQDCLIHVERLKVETEAIAKLKNQIGVHLVNRSRYAEAEPLLKQALGLWRKLFGIENLDVATSINNLAELYGKQGRYAEAEPLLVLALRLWEKLLGIEHPSVALSMNNLAELYRMQGRYAEAEPLYVLALDLREKLFGIEHPDVATSMNNLALLYRMQGRYAEAEPLYVLALDLREKLFGIEHPDVATSMNNLAGLYYIQGRYAEAEPLLAQALRTLKKLFGIEHPDVALSMNNLAELYRMQGRYAEAEPLLLQALGFWKKLFGIEHPDVALSMNNLAALYRMQGRYAEAEPLLLQALDLTKKLFGIEHPDVATGMYNLAELYHEQERYAEAEPLLLQALELRKKLLGVEHPDVALSMNNLALLYQGRGLYAEAEPLLVQALRTLEKKLGENHSDTITVRENFELFQSERASRESQQSNFKDAEKDDAN